MKRIWLIILAFLIVLAVPVFASMEPVLVSEMHVEVSQDVRISSTGNVNELEVKVMIPQEDAFQKVESISVSEPYEFVTDGYGNRMVKVILSGPKPVETLTIKSTVTVLRRNTATLPDLAAFSKPNGLVQSDDKEIADLAAMITAGEAGDFERAATVAQWVNENIKYDLAYADANLSAKTALKNRAGVCDEFSALTMALLRSIGYKAGYIVGYAYGRGYTVADDFVAHGWAEACSGKNCWPIDPTWGEAGWLDATHIKFATLPETYYVEATTSAKGSGQIAVKMDSVKTKITILDSKEEPLFKATETLLDDSVWNGYAVTRTDLTMDGCAYTKIRYGGCLWEKGTFLVPQKNETSIVFCNKGTAFMPFKIPDDMGETTVYTCGLIAAPQGGEQQTVEAAIDPREKNAERPALSVDRTAVKPGEKVEATATGTQIFTSNGLYGTDKLTVVAPARDFTIYAYRNGQMAWQAVSVAENRPLDITVEAPESAGYGEAINVSVRVKNIDTTERSVNVRLGEQTATKNIGAGKSETFAFTTTAQENTIQAFVETDGFSTSASAPITVLMPEKNILEQIMAAIMEWLDSMFGVK